MARKASPAVQIKRLDEAFGKLDARDQLRWIIEAIERIDPASIVLAGAMDSLTYYEAKRWPPKPDYMVGGSSMTNSQVIEMAIGFRESVTTIEQALEALDDHGFEIERIGSEDILPMVSKGVYNG